MSLSFLSNQVVDRGLVDLAEIRAAARSIAGVAIRTPLLPASWAETAADAGIIGAGGDGAGSRLLLKPENLQPVGAFKLRGAYHALSSLDLDARRAGVITHSSGNHGRALAYAAARLGVSAVIVMPNVSPNVKIAAVEALGAEVRLVEPAEREHVTQQIAAARGLTIVPPYDHRHIIAGQGTVGLEIMEDLPDVDVILTPVGGGGLASGVATAAKALKPAVKVFGVEPELAADAKDSLAAGQLRAWPVEQAYRTSADGLRANLSPLTFAHLRARLDGIVTVTEDEIGATVGRLARDARLVVEPSGAVAVAACLYHRGELPAGRTVAIISGGNLEPGLLAQMIAADPSPGR